MFTVYFVDDDAGVLKALVRLLRANHYDVRCFTSPAEFLENHRGRMMQKLCVHSVADLVRLAEKAGITAAMK